MKISGLLLLGIILQSCATFGVNAPPEEMSEALKIARAGGLDDIRDISRKDLNNVYKLTKHKKGSTVTRASMAAGTASGVFAPPPGFSKAGSTALLGFGAFLSFISSDRGPESYFRIFAWMPESEAPTDDDARARLREIFVDAYQKALPNYKVSLIKAIPVTRKAKRKEWYIQIIGGNCNPECGVYAPTFNFEDPKLENSPKFLGGHNTWVWKYATFSRQRGMCCGGYPLNEGNLKLVEKIKFLQKLSKYLPNWLYIYTPPHKFLAGLPMIFSSGKQMLFVKPEKSTNTKVSLNKSE